MTGTRVLLYALVGSWAGSEAEANWADVLAHNTAGTVTTGVLLVGFRVVLAVMWRRDRKRGRFGGER